MVNKIIVTHDQGRLHIGAVDANSKCVRLGSVTEYRNWFTKFVSYAFSTDIKINNKVHRVNTSELALHFRELGLSVNLNDRETLDALLAEDSGYNATVASVALAGKQLFSQALSPEKIDSLTSKLVTNLAAYTRPQPNGDELEDKDVFKRKIESQLYKGASAIREFYKLSLEDGSKHSVKRPEVKDVQSTQGHYYSYTPSIYLTEANLPNLARIAERNKANEENPPINRTPADEKKIKYSYVVTGVLFWKKLGIQVVEQHKLNDTRNGLIRA